MNPVALRSSKSQAPIGQGVPFVSSSDLELVIGAWNLEFGTFLYVHFVG
jgi:hypothetical protein